MMSDRKIRVLVCRVGEQPRVEEIEPTLRGMRSIVDGYLQCVPLEDGVDLWCDEEGGPLCKNLPFSRDVAPSSARGYHHLHGPFFLTRHDDEGEATSLTDEDIAVWRFKLWLGPVPEHVLFPAGDQGEGGGTDETDEISYAAVRVHGKKAGWEDYSGRAEDVAQGEPTTWAWPFSGADAAYISTVGIGSICEDLDLDETAWDEIESEWCAAFRRGYADAHAASVARADYDVF
jgi:hypothetical protein